MQTYLLPMFGAIVFGGIFVGLPVLVMVFSLQAIGDRPVCSNCLASLPRFFSLRAFTYECPGCSLTLDKKGQILDASRSENPAVARFVEAALVAADAHYGPRWVLERCSPLRGLRDGTIFCSVQIERYMLDAPKANEATGLWARVRREPDGEIVVGRWKIQKQEPDGKRPAR